MADSIYLDNAATTRLHPKALVAMEPTWRQLYANPSAGHLAGATVEKLVDRERRVLTELVGVAPKEVIFTSGGSEADNLALFGTAPTTRQGRLIVSAIEHPAVLESAKELEQRGFDVQFAPVDMDGLVDTEALIALVNSETFLVSIIHGNNEIGTVQPVEELARRVKKKNPETRFHTDAVQTFGHLPVRLTGSAIDLLSLSAHKFHGPKGVGALVARNGTRLKPLVFGGMQEEGRRAGTTNVPGIVGMVAAAVAMHENCDEHNELLSAIATHLRSKLQAGIAGIVFNGHPEQCLPGLVSMSVPGIKSQNLMIFLEDAGVLVSAGAACKSTSVKQSHVLEAIGRRPNFATIRISAGIENTIEEADEAAERIISVVKRLRT
jgi:cysteine desulfurase